jgi:hypothetical protein
LVMASSLLERSVSVTRQAAELVVQRTDINWCNIAPGRVQIAVNVMNVGESRSQPTIIRLQAAPLGAFVPWKELTGLFVPSIEAGESIKVAAEAATPLRKALGEFSRVPPRKLLTAVGSQDEPEPQPEAANGLGQMFARLLRGPESELALPILPDDPLELLMRPHVHWAGNINVLIGRKAVERHCAQGLKIYPGRTNLADFFVGDRSDEYQFELTGSGASWEAALFDCNSAASLAAARQPAATIERSKWIRLHGMHLILLAFAPPADCESGSVEVHVRQRSTDKDAVVEFSLEASAAGAGCYAV